MMDIEKCWILIGKEKPPFWVARYENMSKGLPTEVEFDPNYVLEREEWEESVVGMLHLHPHMLAFPSERDDRTMHAWVCSLGKPLICAIFGDNGLHSFIYDDDESSSHEAPIIKVGKYLVGTYDRLY